MQKRYLRLRRQDQIFQKVRTYFWDPVHPKSKSVPFCFEIVKKSMEVADLKGAMFIISGAKVDKIYKISAIK